MLSVASMTIATMLLGVSLAQHPQQISAQALAAYQQQIQAAQQQQSTQNTTPKPYFPPAQVHYVNIGEDLAGDYKFGYDTGKSGAGQSFREESRLPDGTVKGAYGYIDAEGKQRIVKYTAGIEGFKVESDEEAPGQGGRASPAAAAPSPAPAPVRTYSPPPTTSSVSAVSSASASTIAQAQAQQAQQLQAQQLQAQIAAQLQLQSQAQQQQQQQQIQQQLPPSTSPIRIYAPGQLPPITVRTYQASPSSSSTPTTSTSSTAGQLVSSQPTYRIVTTSAAQPLGGYTPVAHTTSTVQPQYVATLPSQTQARPQPQQQQQQVQSSPATIQISSGNQYSSASLPASIATYQTISPVSQLSPATLRALAGYGQAQPTIATTQARSATPLTLSALLAQARASPVSAHRIASIPRVISQELSPPQPQTLQQAQAAQEATTWGPPVINKELLSYNIGVQQG